jgi:molybdopterin-guanine dinucleotide biosynthesis protein A
VLVLAVDMPRVGPELLRLLADRPGPATVIPVAAGRAQPLCARWGPAALALIDELLGAGERSLRALLAAVEADPQRSGGLAWVKARDWEPVAGADAFADVDTPDDFRRLLEGP